MLVSIIVASYNYGRYLRQAIDSALNQTHRDTEVIVVDDSSTDDSVKIIRSYGDSVVFVPKENGGHASSINAGFVASRGSIVCPLDSDDAFTPHKVERVVEAWKREPDTNLVYHQLVTMDAAGKCRGRPWPSATWNGDIRSRLQTTGGWWPRPTTSGLAFSRTFLQRVLPMPVGYRIWPDTYLAPVAALLGPIVGLCEPLGSYRVHDSNTIFQYFPKTNVKGEQLVVGKRLADQYRMEQQLLAECLAMLMASPPTLSLENHPDFLRARRTSGEKISLLQLATNVAKCPAIPLDMKLKSIAQVLLGR